ncbi:DUF1819 family protein [Bengtsoniella intestinalis]|uniref:BrxA family protein n=1 Tax=Bengtsoniella intestinalis TaxID=3073143 RepID=UPI00391FC04E
MLNLVYTSSIKDMPLLFSEMRRTAILLQEGHSKEQILTMSAEQNIYQLNRERRRRELPLRIFNRLNGISSSLLPTLAWGDEQEGKLVALLTLLKADRLFFEYINEVFLDCYQAGKEDVSDHLFVYFIESKAQESDKVAAWGTCNLVSIRNAYKNILCEVGLAKKTNEGMAIQKPFVDSDFRNLLQEEDAAYVRAILLEVS